MATLINEMNALPLVAFTRSGSVLVAEASDLKWAGVLQLYDDACDVGIGLRSHRTGKIVVFYYDRPDMNGDEQAGWRFKPVRPSDCPAITEVLIIND